MLLFAGLALLIHGMNMNSNFIIIVGILSIATYEIMEWRR